MPSLLLLVCITRVHAKCRPQQARSHELDDERKALAWVYSVYYGRLLVIVAYPPRVG